MTEPMTLTKNASLLLKEAAKSYNLTYTLHAPFADINIASPVKPLLNASLKRLKQSLPTPTQSMLKCGCFTQGNAQESAASIQAQTLNRCAKASRNSTRYAEEYGINIALENLPAKYWFLMNTPEEFLKMYKETNLPIGITMDLGHANLEGQIQPFFNLLADKIVHIHASNNDGSDDQHFGVEDGNIDYNWFAETLKKIGYDKTVIVESMHKVPESIQKLKQLLA